MIDWLAICIPVYPPHYKFAYTFIKNTNNLFHLYYVFSSQEDYELFEQKDKIHPLIFPEVITKNPESIINIKKIFGLHCLQNSSHKYILVMDAETDFLYKSFNEESLYFSIESFFDKKQIYGKNISNSTIYKTIQKVMKSSAEALPVEYWLRILEETKEFSVYTWWSDLPVYKREHIPHFLSVLEVPKITWYHFDHMLYSYYLIAYEGFGIYDLTPLVKDSKVFIEDFIPKSESEIEQIHSAGVSYLYVCCSLYEKFPSVFDRIGSQFLFHLNRKQPE
jgi:hypothetical protein